MLSVTADTNIYILGLHFGGTPRRFLDLVRAGVFRLDISQAIQSEVMRVLREDFAYPEQALREVHERIKLITHLVTPTETLDIIKADPSDIGYSNALPLRTAITSSPATSAISFRSAATEGSRF